MRFFCQLIKAYQETLEPQQIVRTCRKKIIIGRILGPYILYIHIIDESMQKYTSFKNIQSDRCIRSYASSSLINKKLFCQAVTGSTVKFFKISFYSINFMLVINLPVVLHTSWHHVRVYSGTATNKKLQ